MEIRIPAILAWLDRWKVPLAIGLGIALRLVAYASGRSLWMDEASLADNIEKLTPIGFFRPLRNCQLAPPAFLVAAWSTVQVFGNNVSTLRLIPLLGGIGSMFLFVAAARRFLPASAVFPAVLMFAVANDPVYYASEFKQYSTDLAACLAWLLAAAAIGQKSISTARATRLAVAGAAVVWFSHPSAFVLASVGLVNLGHALAARDWRRAVAWSAIGLAWAASLAEVNAVARTQLSLTPTQMYVFWGFAFPPMPPRSFWDATWIVRRLAYFFINPLNFDAPFGERLSLLPALGLAIVGAVRLWRIDRPRFALLMLPVALTMMAAALQFYPFHGRVVLFLVPIPLIALAAGLDAVRATRVPRVLYYALVAMVLVVPTLAALKQAVDPWTIHNWIGDLHPYDIDPFKFPF